jgi:hypothetical protein
MFLVAAISAGLLLWASGVFTKTKTPEQIKSEEEQKLGYL